MSAAPTQRRDEFRFKLELAAKQRGYASFDLVQELFDSYCRARDGVLAVDHNDQQIFKPDGTKQFDVAPAPKEAARMLRELAKYVYPTLKSIELSQDPENPLIQGHGLEDPKFRATLLGLRLEDLRASDAEHDMATAQ